MLELECGSVEFDAKSHTYTIAGTVLPSVTEIIGQFREVNVYGVKYYCDVFSGQVIKASTMRAAADYGTAVHKMAALYVAGTLDEPRLPRELVAPLKMFKEWEQTFRPRYLLVEQPMTSGERCGTLPFAGTPDIICTLGDDSAPVVVDIKTGEHDMAGPQLAAYSMLLRVNNKQYRPTSSLAKFKPIGRAVLSLPKKGKAYSFTMLPLETATSDWFFFVARFQTYNYLKGKGKA